MLRKIGRLFVIKTRWEAYLIIFALALGAMDRGSHYLAQYPGWGGWMLFAACSGAVFLGGAKILDCLRLERENAELIAMHAEQHRIQHEANLGFGKKPAPIDPEDFRPV